MEGQEENKDHNGQDVSPLNINTHELEKKWSQVFNNAATDTGEDQNNDFTQLLAEAILKSLPDVDLEGRNVIEKAIASPGVVADHNSSLIDPAGKGAEAEDPDCNSADSVNKTKDLISWEQKKSANEPSQEAPEEIMSLASYEDPVQNKSGMEQNVPELEPQVINNIECNEGLADHCVSLNLTMDSVVEKEMWECDPPRRAPSQPVSVNKNAHSLREGDSSSPLLPHELGVKLNPTKEIFSGDERKINTNAANSSSSSYHQDSSNNNNDRNIIQVNPDVISQNTSQSSSGDGFELAGFQADNLLTDLQTNTNIVVNVVGSNLVFTVPPSQATVIHVIPFADLPQPHSEKRKSSDSDSLAEAGPSSPAKRQRTDQFPDRFKQMETVDRVEECDQFLKGPDNLTSCVGFLGGMLSKIEGLNESKTNYKTKATNEVMSELLTTSCATKFNWAGQSKISNKIGITRYTSFCGAIFKLLDPEGIAPGDPRWDQKCNKEVKDAIQKWLKGAPKRK